MCGLCAALTCAQAAHDPLTWGAPLAVIYASAYTWQRMMQRDWRADFAITGLICSAYVVLMEMAGRRPDGLLNRQVVAGVLAVLLPSATTLPRRRAWFVAGAMMAALLVTGSRGGLLAGLIALAASQANFITIKRSIIALPVLIVLIISAVFIRPIQAFNRVFIWQHSLQALMTSPVFGVGPGGLGFQVGREWFDHGHNSLVSIAAMCGLVGIGLIALFVASSNRRVSFERWQWATFSALAGMSLFDDALMWLPVGLVVSIVLGTNREQSPATNVAS